MQDFYLYILQCADGSYYTGHTDDIEQRLADHMEKKYNGYTATRLPVKLVFLETFASRYEAFEAEKQIQRWTRKKKEILISDGWQGFVKKQNTVRMDSTSLTTNGLSQSIDTQTAMLSVDLK